MKVRILCNLNSIIITLIFSIAIFVPFSIGIVEKDKNVSVIEKRKLSTFPKIGGNINDIKKFPKLFDTYYSDHFGLRDWFTKYYKLVKFNLGDSPSNDVTIGKDGWLFLGSIKKGYNKYSDPIGDVRNINLFSKSDLKKFATYMVSLKRWLNDKGIEYVFVIAPNKHTIYFDKLPDYISKANKYSSTDQLVEYLKFHTNVTVVDLRKILIENKKKHQLYYKTDTHWNHFAANIAQYEIILEIEKLFPKLINPEIVKLKEEVRDGGDLAGFIGMNDFIESGPQPIFENSCNPVKYPEDAKDLEPHSFSCEGQKLNAVIFRDSFFAALQPYFSRKFKRSTYLWGKLNYSSLEKYVSSENPDVIIEELVERNLPFVPNITPELNRKFNKKLFECNNKSVFLNNFRKLTYNAHIKRMDGTDKSIRIKSVGRDPIISFPLLPLERAIQYIVHIEVKSSVNSMLQLFYSDSDVAGYPFSEKNSVRVGVNSGENDIYILLDYDKLGKQLRLDPISRIGEVEIKTIEIREIKNQ
jgi:alginate O-acetyltransferase complex protein AlgJ